MPKITKISSPQFSNFPEIFQKNPLKKMCTGDFSGIITNLWTGKASDAIDAYVGAASAGDYSRLKNFEKFKNVDGVKFSGSGKGWTPEQAEISAIGEFFERYSSGFFDEKLLTISTELQLQQSKKNVLCLKKISIFSDAQYSSQNFPFKKVDKNTEISWIETINVSTGQQEYIPAVFLLFPFHGNVNDTKFIPSSTNGLAAHKSDPQAKLSALLELLERDFFANIWLSGSQFECEDIPGDDKWNTFFENFNGESFCIFPENDFEIPFCMLTLKFPCIDGESLIVSGSACGKTKKEAFSSALLEVFQGKKYLEFEEKKIFSQNNFSDVQSFTDHCQFYSSRPEVFSKIPLYKNTSQLKAQGKNLKNTHEKNPEKISDENFLEKIIQKFQEKNFSLYFYDLTSIDTALIGIKVWRAYSPELSSLYGDERFPYQGQKRIFDSFFKNTLSRNKGGVFNTLPHFLG